MATPLTSNDSRNVIQASRPRTATEVARALELACRAWILLTTCFLVGNGAIVLLLGSARLHDLVQEGPLSRLSLTLVSVAIAWLVVGAALFALGNRALRERHWLTVLCAFFVLMLYANILRERLAYADVRDYVLAAHDLAQHTTLHARYLYPPFFATVLAALLPLGDLSVEWICWAANMAALGLFVVLLRSALLRYGFGEWPSALATVAFAAINVPILRSLGYVQVNLHVVNMILIAILGYPRWPILSALALALAVHIKASPAVLALAFLIHRDGRWTGWFVAMLAALSAVTVLPFGWRPFVDVWHNVRHIYDANGIAFRETSVDSFFRSWLGLMGQPLGHATPVVVLVKLGIFAAVLATMARAIKNHAFVSGDEPGATVLNAIPALLVFMLLASPLVWEHHPVMVALSYLLALKRVDTPAEYALYGLAYLLEYQLPTFDFFPWSFGRLLSPLILLGIMYAGSQRPCDGALWRWVTAKLGGKGTARARRMASITSVQAGALSSAA